MKTLIYTFLFSFISSSILAHDVLTFSKDGRAYDAALNKITLSFNEQTQDISIKAIERYHSRKQGQEIENILYRKDQMKCRGSFSKTHKAMIDKIYCIKKLNKKESIHSGFLLKINDSKTYDAYRFTLTHSRVKPRLYLIANYLEFKGN